MVHHGRSQGAAALQAAALALACLGDRWSKYDPFSCFDHASLALRVLCGQIFCAQAGAVKGERHIGSFKFVFENHQHGCRGGPEVRQSYDVSCKIHRLACWR